MHDDEFDPATADLEWLATVPRSWLVLAKDAQLRYPPERDVIVRRRLHVFVITNAGLSGPIAARLLVDRAPSILRFAQSHMGGYIVGVYRDRPPLRALFPRQIRRRNAR